MCLKLFTCQIHHPHQLESDHVADVVDRWTTHIVLDVHVTPSFEQDTHDFSVAFVGSQVQGASAVLEHKTQHRTLSR